MLAGGLDRGFTFERLVPYLKEHVSALVVFGETKELLKEAGKKAGLSEHRASGFSDEIVEAKDAIDAVPKAYALSRPGDTILLSPACASWDQWKTFEERGDKFIEAVENLEKKDE